PAATTAAAIVDGALAQVDRRGRAVEIDVPDGLPAVVTDASLAQRVLANVVTNACRFSPLEQPVRVRVGAVGGDLEILVIDRGPGMSREKRDVVLAAFEHLSGAQLTVGLNLTVASGLARLLGGRLMFEDTPGGGLTVGVELPLEPPAPVPATT
ncbi:MAG TPA: ATP-binding protein, partial [Acidimicrobiales bacterium]|nr:ATP-binding protein [Acidimicrobiales bacterium]